MKNFMKEFKEFIARGNVLDMAIGVIIATAFGKITSTLVGNVITPLLAFLFNSPNTDALNITLRAAVTNAAGEVEKEAIILGLGDLVGAIIDFVIIALIIFAIVKAFNKRPRLPPRPRRRPRKRPLPPPSPKPSPPPPPRSCSPRSSRSCRKSKIHTKNRKWEIFPFPVF